MSTKRVPTHPADKAVLRLATGLGLAVLLAYGLDMSLPFVLCVVTALVLCKPGPPMPLLKGLVAAAALGVVVVAGVLMVPLLEHYAAAGVVLTAALLFACFRAGGGVASPKTMILAIALTAIPVAGVAEQALALQLAESLALGLAIGALVSGFGHALVPDRPAPGSAAPAKPRPPVVPGTKDWTALRATLVVLPVFVLALTNPASYLAALVKSVSLAQQAGASTAHSAGKELVGSTLTGALVAALIWAGLSLRPNLIMLVLWIVAAVFWVGARIFGIKTGAFPPSYWVNVLVTMLILLGPAIEDSVQGKDVVHASTIRVCLFLALALYAWLTVWVLERWRASWPNLLTFRSN